MKDERLLNLLEDILGQPQNPNVQWIYYDCPFCHHHRKKFAVNINTLVWKCWVCKQRGGNLFSLVRKTNNWNLFERVKKATQKFSKELKIDLDGSGDQLKVEALKLPPHTINLSQPSDFIMKKRVYRYLRSRNITDYEIQKYSIHFTTTGKYANRIILPSYDNQGNLNYFTGRSIIADQYLKYLNPKASKDAIIIYENMINWKFPVILTEGIFDAITVNFNAVPLMGKTISNKLLQRLLYYDAEVCIALDSDAWEDQVALMTKLRSLGLQDIFYIKLNGEKDPNTLGRQGFWQAYKAKRVKFTMEEKLDILKQKLESINF